MFADCMSLTIINANYKFDLSMLSEDNISQPMFKDCVNLTGFSPEHTGIEMAKPKTEGGYFTPKGEKIGKCFINGYVAGSYFTVINS